LTWCFGGDDGLRDACEETTNSARPRRFSPPRIPSSRISRPLRRRHASSQPGFFHVRSASPRALSGDDEIGGGDGLARQAMILVVAVEISPIQEFAVEDLERAALALTRAAPARDFHAFRLG